MDGHGSAARRPRDAKLAKGDCSGIVPSWIDPSTHDPGLIERGRSELFEDLVCVVTDLLPPSGPVFREDALVNWWRIQKSMLHPAVGIEFIYINRSSSLAGLHKSSISNSTVADHMETSIAMTDIVDLTSDSILTPQRNIRRRLVKQYPT
ncbi:hypothetical protein P154DRAFT_572705 [Amniculicola lignicola CBS 123094]|uniref:Uncharacterized protein n=1 Tax=Amniculicola lignicola CBS 123094 TaxID=1392246 RepID=A0A6A5WPP3_9PLEO|nr:hypothetical protein P154DRAFT_572705 [Amniculicola lignicola CBS 123094]